MQSSSMDGQYTFDFERWKSSGELLQNNVKFPDTTELTL